ncbi:MAG TPA: ABATE domain-containing protein [Anaerolineaceae bacterium]|nr:ABATE domain-containing protein [Anaerolineaceae bacterium]
MEGLLYAEKALNLEEGWLCLDFANTLDWHASSHPIESIETYADLVNWSARVGLFGAEEAETLMRTAQELPGEAEQTRLRAIELREAIYQIFSALSHDREPSDRDIAALNLYLSQEMANSRIVRKEDGFDWGFTRDANALDRMLGPIARSAAELLASDVLDRVGECADEDGCGWLFLDTTRNHSRQWCSMESCGNRAKAKRHYRRKKTAEN